MDLFVYFPFDSLDDILIVPDNPVFLLDLLLEGYPEILNSGGDLHFFLAGSISLAFFLQFLFEIVLDVFHLSKFDENFTVLFLEIVEFFFDAF